MPWKGYTLKQWGLFSPSQTGPFTASRSKLDRFIECPRCFWIEARYGIGRPDTPPFTLNNVVDELCKKEFDMYREKGEAHPLMRQYGIDAVPFVHENLEEWRDAFKRGIKYHDKETNLILRGGIDDVWQNSKGELHIVDYKATGGKKEVTLDDEWKIAYKRQVEIYQWLFRMNGFTVSPIAYFVYANAQNDRDAFNGTLEFDMTVLPYEGDDSWIHGELKRMRACLDSDEIPEKGKGCEYCPYREEAGKKLMSLARKKK